MAPDPSANMQSSLVLNTGSEAPKHPPVLPSLKEAADVLHETQAGISKEGHGREGALHHGRHSLILMAHPLGIFPKGQHDGILSQGTWLLVLVLLLFSK